MPSIRDFSVGVLNQELQNRDNGNGILFDCKNVLSSWNGELRKRTGTRLLKELEGNSKLIPYRLPDGDDMLMVLRDKVIKCYVFDDDDNLVSYVKTSKTPSSAFPTTGWATDTNGDWTVSGSSTYTAFTTYAHYAVDDSSQSYSYAGERDFEPNSELFFCFENTSPVILSKCTISWKVANFGVSNSYVFRAGLDPIIQYSDDGENWVPIRNIQGLPTIESWTTISSGMIPFPTSHTNYSYSISSDYIGAAHRYWRILFNQKYISGSYNNQNPEQRASVLQISDIVFNDSVTAEELTLNNCPYENEDFDNIRWSQNGTVLTMACRGKTPYQISVSGGSFTDATFVPSDETNLWATIGFPACVTYYQNRLWFAGFESKPTRVYGSKFGEHDKFNIPSTIETTSPIVADGTEISNVIENMWGGNNALYCLSEDGISMIDAQGAIVATNQVEFKLRNREPVNSMVPTVKDDTMIYLGRDKRKILITDYDFVVQRFKAQNISDNYNDFLQSGIKELHYIPRKSSLIYGVLEDGKWFSLLFSIEKNKNSIFPFEISGAIKDVQPIKHGDETKLIMLTHLPSYQYILEEKLPQSDQKIMDFMTNGEKEDYTKEIMDDKQSYLDHSIKMVFESPVSILDNLPYSGDERIEVIADGQYLGAKIVQNNTQTGYTYIELDEPASEVVLGYRYDSYAVLKFVSPYNLRKFPKEISVNFINTGYLEVGNTFDSLKSVLNNLVESVKIDNKKILMNGNYTKTLDKQTFETPYVIVRSDKGLPFIITGIDYKVDMSNYQGGV